MVGEPQRQLSRSCVVCGGGVVEAPELDSEGLRVFSHVGAAGGHPVVVADSVDDLRCDFCDSPDRPVWVLPACTFVFDGAFVSEDAVSGWFACVLCGPFIARGEWLSLLSVVVGAVERADGAEAARVGEETLSVLWGLVRGNALGGLLPLASVG